MANVTTLTDSNGVTKDICDQTARGSISLIEMKAASGLSIPSNATPSDFYSIFGRGLSAIWVNNGNTIGMPANNGTLITALYSDSTGTQVFVTSAGAAYIRTATSSTQTWREWDQFTLT